MNSHFPHLEHLDLTNSGWLSNHSLQAICKCDSLRQLILKGCRKLGECFVYTALATRFGFKNVTLVDLRDTFVGDSEVPCFGRLPNITHLLLGRTAMMASAESGLPGPPSPPPPAGSESNGKITDRGVMSMCLSELEDGNRRGRLETLSLIRTDITDRSLSKLAAAFPLQELDLRGTKVTHKGIEGYRLRRPTCKVHF